MTSHRTFIDEDPDVRGVAAAAPADPSAVMGAVREDIRQTLRVGWIDPAIEAAAGNPVFLTAAWSAIRPNVGKSFLTLARALRSAAAESVRAEVQTPSLWTRLDHQLSGEERQRVLECARAAHLVTAKAQIVVHALNRAVRRDRLGGTGREEAPVRRGVPEWQRWMRFQPVPEAAGAVLEEAAQILRVSSPPPALRLLARWPPVLASLWGELKPVCQTESFRGGAARLRRRILGGVASLPHPIDLQWTALRARGFSEDDQVRLADVLAAHDGAMASHVLTAAYAWTAFGAPDMGADG